MSTVQPARASSTASSNSALRRLTWVGLKTRAGISLSCSARRTSSSPRGPSPRCRCSTPALPVMSPATWASAASRRISSKVGWLERWSLIATSPMPSSGSSSTRSPRTLPVSVVERDVVAARVAVRVESFLAQRVDRRQQFARAACDVVGAEQADDRGHAGVREAGERHRRHARAEAGFAAAAGDVHVRVDQARHEPQAREVDLGREAARARRQGRQVCPDPSTGPCRRRAGGTAGPAAGAHRRRRCEGAARRAGYQRRGAPARPRRRDDGAGADGRRGAPARRPLHHFFFAAAFFFAGAFFLAAFLTVSAFELLRRSAAWARL